MSIRKKLLLVMTGLLVASVALLFVLHLREGDRLRDEIAVVLSEAVDRVLDGDGSDPYGDAPYGGGALYGGGEGFSPELIPDLRDYEQQWTLEKFWSFGPQGILLRLERYLSLSDDGFEDLLAPARHRVLPPGAVEARQLRFKDPIDEVRRDSLPRQALLAGLVLLVGFLLTWFLAGHLTRPLKALTHKMEAVAGGNLAVTGSDSSESGGSSPGRDEVRQMSRAFNTMLERLREKQDLERKMFHAERLSALGTLAAGVAHDIRNPLNTIGLTLDHLQDSYTPQDPERREGFLHHLEDVKAELGRLNTLVRDFLSLAHPDRGETVPCVLEELVEESLRLFRKEAEAGGVVVHARLEKIGPVTINPQQIRRAMTNVLLNALEAMAPSGGSLDVTLFKREFEVVLRFADDGHGVEADELDKIFLPYFTTSPEGTGLGLPIARWALEAHGGRIEVRSRSGEGTEVDLILPQKGSAT